MPDATMGDHEYPGESHGEGRNRPEMHTLRCHPMIGLGMQGKERMQQCYNGPESYG
jgi:hypothetical protein